MPQLRELWHAFQEGPWCDLGQPVFGQALQYNGGCCGQGIVSDSEGRVRPRGGGAGQDD
jgi:hypothetical protein